MGIWSTCKFYSAEEFCNGVMDEFLHDSSYTVKGRKHVVEYSNLICTADTETSHIGDDDNEIGWVYQWSICLWDRRTNPYFVYGRTPEQMMKCYEHMVDIMELSSKRQLLCFYHNFGYDYSYLKNFIKATIDKGVADDERELLATGPHKIISYKTASGIQFRCSWRLSNASLDFWSRKVLLTKHKKLVGEIDYDVVRFQDSKLNRSDWRYMIYDVLVDAECIDKILSMYGDTLAKIPLTSTGYVRRETRKNFQKDKGARTEFLKAHMSERSYNALKKAQQGGYTHASRFHAGKIVDVKDFPGATRIGHFDMRSFYPSMQRVKKFPVSKLILEYEKPSPVIVYQARQDNTKCHLFAVYFKNGTLKPVQPFPIISVSKLRQGKMSDDIDITDDNGRVLEFKGSSVLYVTDQDLEIIEKQYEFEKEIFLEIWSANADYLPQWMIKTIDTFYHGKSHWKMMTKARPDIPDYETFLMRDKGGLNGIYGMTATDPVHDSYYEQADGQWLVKPQNIAEQLAKYYDSYNSFMWLQWGVWCTSWARYELMLEAEAIGWEHILYADTDSLFFISNKNIENAIAARNQLRYNNAINIKAYITMDDGSMVTYDAFEDEKEDIVQFKALHSKCYGFVTTDGKLKITIAGVAKAYKGTTREQELGNLDNLKHKFVFKKCGGTSIKYHESPITKTVIDGHEIMYASSGVIHRVEKTLKYDEMDEVEELRYTDIS